MNPRMRPEQAIRFDPDKGQHAYISTKLDSSEFCPNIRGEIIDESRTGCGVVVYNSAEANDLQPGHHCIAQVGKLEPVEATIVWRKIEGDETAVRLGLKYQE